MTAASPTAQLAAIDSSLAAVLDDAKAIKGGGPKKTRLAAGLVAAEAATAKGDEQGCKDAIAALAAVQDEAKALEGRPNKHVKACVKAAEAALPALEAIDWGVTPPPPPPPPPPGKATVDFDEVIGQIGRAPGAETVRQVQVLRHGSTHAAATAGVKVIGLPDGVLVAAEPAAFEAGQARSYVALRFSPAPPAGLRDGAPMTGLADLTATADLDPGTAASQSFTVVDGAPPPPPPPPGDKWWSIPGGTLSGNAWPIGVNSTGWNKATVSLYKQQVGRQAEAFCAANHKGATAASWSEVQAQAGINNNTSGFGGLISSGVKGKTRHVLNLYTHPVGVPAAEIIAGTHDAEFVQLGQNLRAEWGKTGLEDWQIAIRTNKEFNQDPYLPDASHAPLYSKVLARAIKGIRQGFGTTSRGRLRFSLSPARQAIVGPVESFCSFDTDGSCLYDTVSCSTHPANQLNVLAGKPWDEQVAGVLAWLEGGYKPGYSYLNKDPNLSVKALVEKYDLAFSADEWVARNEPKMYCAIGAASMQAIHDFFVSVQDRLAWDCVYDSNVLTEQDICPGWADASRKYKALWGK